MEFVLKIIYICIENLNLPFSELLCYCKHCILWEVKMRDRKNTIGRFFSSTGIQLLSHHTCMAVLSHDKPTTSKINFIKHVA